MDYIFCARNLKNNRFGGEPGPARFLAVPESSGVNWPAQKMRKSDWLMEIRDAAKSGTVDGFPSGDIVIYVHGFNTSQKVMLERHRKIRAGLEAHGFGGVVVSFDWPSQNSALNYLEDRTDAKLTAFKLVEEGIKSFAALQRPDCRINVHILAHSMGCFVVREAFDDADDRPAVAARSWSVSQVMLLSGDISASSLEEGNPKSSSLYRHCVRLTNYHNPYDDILSLSDVKRIGVAPRVGRIGLPDNLPEKAVSITCGPYYKKHRKKYDGVIENASHIWYFYDGKLLQDIHYTIQGKIDRHDIPTRGLTDKGNLALVP